MSPNLGTGGWIHSFAITDTQTHKNGYTIYKITSIVFPRSVPQALTCLTIWKRFHDIKRLHRELSRRHKSLNLRGELPEPTDCSYFKRFNAEVIQRRKEYILQLLDFTAQHPALYKCHAFAHFFSDAQSMQSPTGSPLHHIHVKQYKGDVREEGAITEICDKLDLLYDPHNNGLALLNPECDKDIQINKSSNDEAVTEVTDAINNAETKVDILPSTDNDTKCKDYTRFLTPMASIESDDSDYIYEAALEFSNAVKAEVNLEYKNAYMHYKRGVEFLQIGSKDDSNEDRKFIAETKISKYLARADDIYDKFLRCNTSDSNLLIQPNLQFSIDIAQDYDALVLNLERPWHDLSKYKVLQVFSEGVLQVQNTVESQRPMYIMKGIEKPSSNSSAQTILLPQHVPYMVELIAFFQSDQKIFLLLRQAAGGHLYDYVQNYKASVVKSNDFAGLFPEVEEIEAEIVSNTSNMSAEDSGFIENSLTVKQNPVAISKIKGTSNIINNGKDLMQSYIKTYEEVEDVKASSNVEENQQVEDVVEIVSPSNVKYVQLPEASLKQWARELAVAIHSLHEKGVILGDLHMENVLLGAKGQLQLSYFYQNVEYESDNNAHKTLNLQAIDGHFVAPERPLTFKSDWWSYGVVLYQLLLRLSFKEAHPGQLDYYGCVQYPEDMNLTENAINLLDNLLQQIPEERFDYEQIQKHAFFEGTNWKDVLHNGLNNHCTTFSINQTTAT